MVAEDMNSAPVESKVVPLKVRVPRPSQVPQPSLRTVSQLKEVPDADDPRFEEL